MSIEANVHEEITKRRALGPAASAAHPALASTPGTSPPRESLFDSVLPRTPRSSTPLDSETLVTPAPVLADLLAGEVLELVEDSGLLQCLSEPDARSREKIEVVSSELLQDLEEDEVIALQELEDLEEIEEIASEHLAFVEARGEIDDTSKLNRRSDLPSPGVSCLHEQSVGNGIVHRSDGVPPPSLSSRQHLSRTLRVPAITTPIPPVAHRRYAMIALVFVAGVGAGLFLGMRQNTSAPATALPAPVQVTQGDLAPQPEVAPAQATTPPTSQGAILVTPLVEPAADQSAEEGRRDERPQVTPLESAPAPISASSQDTGSAPLLGTADPGVLMLGAKPPCSIRINGKDTGLVTPQRHLRLSPGEHDVTLINREHRIRDRFKVSIRSGQKTRVVRDMTGQIR